MMDTTLVPSVNCYTLEGVPRMVDHTFESLVETVVLERLNLDPHIKLTATVALANLRIFRQLSAEAGIPMDQLSRELLIEKLTGHPVSGADIEAIRLEVKAASDSEDVYDVLRLLAIPSTGPRKKRRTPKEKN